MLRAAVLTKLANLDELKSPICRCLVYLALLSCKHSSLNGDRAFDSRLDDRARQQLISIYAKFAKHNLKRLEDK